jgi:predicted unusual protein kinase regulating ubiquinone biosynthesis (AarF/ABC1/UbiB family)
MAERQRGSGRIARSTKLGGVAAGHAARSLGTKAANLVRDEQAADEAMARQALETADRLVSVLSTMKGAAMKLGQTFSVVDLGLVPEEQRAEFQAKLAKLQAGAKPHPFKEIRTVVEQDLGERLSSVFSDFSQEPIAAASIGQVHRATTHDGRDVAVKVQYPGIKDAVRADLQNLGLGLKLLARISPGLDTKEIAAEVRERITEELDYELEASNQRAIARQYRGHPFVVVPDVVTPLCRERVIVSDFVDGRRFEEILSLPDAERARFGEILARFYVNGPMRHRLLNGDPHPGNSLFLADGRVAFIDFGFFKRLTDTDIRQLLASTRATYDKDAQALYDVIAELGALPDDDRLAEPFLESYTAIFGWLLTDERITVDGSMTADMMRSYNRMRRLDGFDSLTLPAEHFVLMRGVMLLIGLVGQLRGSGTFLDIAREWLLNEPPATELGKQEAEFFGGRYDYLTSEVTV